MGEVKIEEKHIYVVAVLLNLHSRPNTASFSSADYKREASYLSSLQSQQHFQDFFLEQSQK